jgi:ABC-type glycerol-3-phosphate transport system permease component
VKSRSTYRKGFFPRALSLAWRVGLAFLLLFTFYPFLFMAMTSLKDTHQFYHTFWLPAFPAHWENYTLAFSDLARYLANSLLVTTVSIAGILLFSCVSGFIYARYDFPGRSLLYYGVITMMMIPGVLMLVPSFVWVHRLNLIDTYWVMILPYIAGGQVLGTYLMRGFFSEIDNDLFEAAQVDGSGLFGQLWHVAIPLAKPILGVVAIVSALGVWNNFLWPLVTTSSEEVMVLTVGILRYNSRVYGQYGRMFAGYTLSAIPLVILFAVSTRVFLKGITAGALKG